MHNTHKHITNTYSYWTLIFDTEMPVLAIARLVQFVPNSTKSLVLTSQGNGHTRKPQTRLDRKSRKSTQNLFAFAKLQTSRREALQPNTRGARLHISRREPSPTDFAARSFKSRGAKHPQTQISPPTGFRSKVRKLSFRRRFHP
jgi:hypothetical protein